MKRVMISAAGTMASVSYIKLLRDNGFYVVGINAVDSELASYYCNEFHRVPLVTDEDNYIKAISNIEFDVFVPWLDEEHILFSKRECSFSSKILTSPAETIQITTDKFKTYEFCVSNGINTAKKKNVAPAFVRAKFSRGSKNAKVVSDQDELDKLDKSKFLCQEILHGTEYTVDILCSAEGEYIYGVPRKRLEAVNVSTISQVDMDDAIIAFCKDICDKLKFAGPINIQVFKDNHKISLVEINPRLAGTSILTIKSGFDLLNDSIRMFLGEKVDTNYTAKNGMKMYRFYDELYI